MQSRSGIQSVLSLYNEIKIRHINLCPPYQRGVIWEEKCKKLFINSILIGIVPNNLIFNIDHEQENWICIDGKQRLTSIVDFIGNKFPILWNGKLRYYSEGDSILSKNDRYKFDEREMFIVKYSNLSYKDQLMIFSRIQNGKPMSAGEKILCYFVLEEDLKIYVQFCEQVYKRIEKFMRQTKFRKAHYVFIGKLMTIYEQGNNLYPSVEDVCNYVNKIENIESIVTKLSGKLISVYDFLTNKKFPKLILFNIIVYLSLIFKYLDSDNYDKKIIIFGNALHRNKKQTFSANTNIIKKFKMFFNIES